MKIKRKYEWAFNILATTGVGCIFVAVFIFPLTDKGFPSHATVYLFWIGILIALAGNYFGDEAKDME